MDITAELYELDRVSYDRMVELGFEVFPEHSEDALLKGMHHPMLTRDYYDDEGEADEDWDDEDDEDDWNAGNNVLFETVMNTMTTYKKRGYKL